MTQKESFFSHIVFQPPSFFKGKLAVSFPVGKTPKNLEVLTAASPENQPVNQRFSGFFFLETLIFPLNFGDSLKCRDPPMIFPYEFSPYDSLKIPSQNVPNPRQVAN